MSEEGVVILKIDERIKERNMSVTKLGKESKIQYAQAKNYCSGNMQKVDLSILAKICHTLDCEISDLLEYIPPQHKSSLQK